MINQGHDKLEKTGRVAPSHFEQLGGEAVLRKIIDDFIDRVFQDRMIGFFFRNATKERIKEMEYQLSASFLGADIKYQGLPLDKVHAKHPIMGGHFARRRRILQETLEFHRVPGTIQQAWLQHTDALRPLITPESGSECDAIATRRRVKGK